MKRFDEIFDKIGHFGVYQLLAYCLIGIVSFYNGYQNISVNFLGGHQPHWCKIERLSKFSHERQRLIAVPDDDTKDKWSYCQVFNLNYTSYTDDELLRWTKEDRKYFQANASRINCPNDWVFDQSQFILTTLSKVGVSFLTGSNYHPHPSSS
ncbi:unnamed protein product [Dimorphilus gyrociliatus]|uniref:Uncharacterized protein n=1 Tax=Dimorphilus gyrociliatus TaxID=2664684 RepID=A0A7I8VHP8_9ANNE|nr:unnamed protein product [Dimorphilus gyrociliatus]